MYARHTRHSPSRPSAKESIKRQAALIEEQEQRLVLLEQQLTEAQTAHQLSQQQSDEQQTARHELEVELADAENLSRAQQGVLNELQHRLSDMRSEMQVSDKLHKLKINFPISKQ